MKGAARPATSMVAGISRMVARIAPARMAAARLPDSDQDAQERITHRAA